MKRLSPANLNLADDATARMVETPDGLEYQADGPDYRIRIPFPDAMWTTDPRWRWIRDRVRQWTATTDEAPS